MSGAGARRSRLKDPWVIGALAAIVLLTLTRPLFVHEAPPPPAGAALPAFELVDQHGRAFGSAELAGRVWVAALLPAEPGEKAARALDALLRLQKAWEGFGRELLLVAVAVEPERQDPESLRRLGVERGADFARLKFLGGDADSTCRVASAFTEDARIPPREQLTRLAERGRLLVVDAAGRSRGLYRSDVLGVEEVHFRSLAVLGDE